MDPILFGNLVQVIGLSVAMILILARFVKEREELQRKASLSLTENESVGLPERKENEDPLNGTQFMTLKSGAILDLNELFYINSEGGYCEFYLKGKDYPEIDRKSLVSLESE